MPARSYQQQLDHLNTIVTKMHRHKNVAIGRFKNPVIFDDWFEEVQALLFEADDEEVYTVQLEEERKLSKNPTEDEKFDCYIAVLHRSAEILAYKKIDLRVNEYEASSEYYTCAGDREYEMTATEFRVRGEVVRLEPNEAIVMKIVLSDANRNVKATDAAKEISGDAEYVIEIPHIISDINAKIKENKDAPNPLSRIGGEKLSNNKRASIWHLYLHDEPRPIK